MAIKRKWYRSRPYTLATAGSLVAGVINIDNSYLDGALSLFTAPIVTKKWIRINFSAISTGNVGGPVRFVPRIFDKILLNDGVGERISISGASYRAAAQHELGRNWTPGRAVAVSQTGVAFEAFLPLNFSPKKAAERTDYAIPLAEFLKGGRLDLTVATASAFGTNQFTALTTATLEILTLVEEGGTPELKSRMVLKEFNLLKVEDTYPIGGTLRYALLYGGVTAEDAGTLWPVGTYTSDTLQMSNIPGSVLAEHYMEESEAYRGVDTIVVATGDDMILAQPVVQAEFTMSPRFVVPIYTLHFDQPLTELPGIPGSLHIKIDGGALPGSATDQKVIICSITGRDETMSAVTLGCAPAEVVAKLGAAGQVASLSGDKPLVGGSRKWSKRLSSILPLRLPKSGGNS